MPDPVADAPVENKEEQPKPKLDATKPLTQQVDKLIKQLPPEEKPEDPKKPAEPEKPEEEAEVEEPEEVVEDEDDEEYEAPKVDLPDWQQYILDNLPDIKTVGHVGNKSDKVYTVKRLEDLPDDFEFASKRAELAFSAALSAQEVNARELLTKYNTEKARTEFESFQNQEALDIQADIKALQREGVIPKFKYSENDDRFNDDPAVQMSNEIYDLYKKTNQAYMNANKTYRISYRDATDKYLARKGFQKAENDNKQAERTKVAEKVSAPSGTSPESVKRGMPRGASMQDVLKLYKMGRI